MTIIINDLLSDIEVMHKDVDNMLCSLPWRKPHPHRFVLYQTKCRLEYWIMRLKQK